jgi:hypothetical protein
MAQHNMRKPHSPHRGKRTRTEERDEGGGARPL